jgi:hypothetical protein
MLWRILSILKNFVQGHNCVGDTEAGLHINMKGDDNRGTGRREDDWTGGLLCLMIFCSFSIAQGQACITQH